MKTIKQALVGFAEEFRVLQQATGAELAELLAAELDEGRATPATTLAFLMAVDEAEDKGAQFDRDALDALESI